MNSKRQARLPHFRRRLSLGLTQKQVATHAGVSGKTVCHFELGYFTSEESRRKIMATLYNSNNSTPGTVSVWDNKKGKTITTARGFN